MRNYFQKFIISEDAIVFWGDTVKVMSTLQPESVDVIFADPPYFLSNGGISVKSGKSCKR